jgi:signal transduction histidine kinase/CheY-like chemotaxis protein
MQEYAIHDNRENILSYISNNPGNHMRRISRDLSISLSTLRYHLLKLEKNGSISSQKQDNFKIYFASGKLKPEEKALAQLLQQQRFRDIVLVLIDSPGSTFSQISEKLSMSPSTASKYINVLEDRNIIFHEREGRKKRYRIKDEQSVISFLKTYKNFMTSMSYEIRNPMNAIVGMASLLLEDDITEKQREFVETIRISADALMSIVNEVLGFSTMELEKAELEIETFSLRECIEDALQSVAEKAATKCLDIAYEIDRGSPDVIIGDLKKLRQILIQLLCNAIKFTYKGNIIVSVSSKQDESLYELNFSIKDTGIGIPVDKLEDLWNANRYLRDPNRKEKKVAAKGLFLCRELVELMSGKIWAESTPGIGSTFHFAIRTKNIPHISPLSGVQLSLEEKQLLIVHANKDIGKIIEDQAMQWGMLPLTCFNGQEAIDLLSGNRKFHVALLDICLPGEGGLSLGEEIHKTNTSLPLVALAFSGQRIDSGIYKSVLIKPIKQVDLFKVLRDSLAERSIAKASEENMVRAGSTVLVAEDNISNQKVVVSMLKRLGYSAEAVFTGREALEALENGNYSFVIMDVRMPEMDGLEATRMIREKLKSDIKIIAVTAYALKGDRERCLEAGMDDYLSKPVRIEDLKLMLKKHNLL